MRRLAADVVVVGAGPAGIAASVSAAECGARVLVIDDNAEPGGQIWRSRSKQKEHKAAKWFERFQAAPVQKQMQTRVLGLDAPGRLLAEHEREACFVEFKSLVLATGGRELFLPFPGWTLPGVAGAGGLQALAEGGLPMDGKRVVVAGSGPLSLAVAVHLRERGAVIAAIAEQAPFGRVARFGASLSFGKLLQAAEFGWALRGIPMLYSAWPMKAQGTEKLTAVQIKTSGRVRTIACDYLACGFGLLPNTELAQLFGCELRDGFVAVNEEQRTTVPDVFCAGEPTGISGVDGSLAEGQVAGFAAAGRPTTLLAKKRAASQRFGTKLAGAFALRNELKAMCTPETIVCRCEDVSLERINAYADWKGAKLQTRCGMGPCQGRMCGPAIAFLTDGRLRCDAVRLPVFAATVETLACGAAEEEEQQHA